VKGRGRRARDCGVICKYAPPYEEKDDRWEKVIESYVRRKNEGTNEGKMGTEKNKKKKEKGELRK
jgi:hypothetical protein